MQIAFIIIIKTEETFIIIIKTEETFIIIIKTEETFIIIIKTEETFIGIIKTGIRPLSSKSSSLQNLQVSRPIPIIRTNS